jgi:hypothetical protein
MPGADSSRKERVKARSSKRLSGELRATSGERVPNLQIGKRLLVKETNVTPPHPRGIVYRYQKKALAQNGTRKPLKIKGRFAHLKRKAMKGESVVAAGRLAVRGG